MQWVDEFVTCEAGNSRCPRKPAMKADLDTFALDCRSHDESNVLLYLSAICVTIAIIVGFGCYCVNAMARKEEKQRLLNGVPDDGSNSPTKSNKSNLSPNSKRIMSFEDQGKDATSSMEMETRELE